MITTRIAIVGSSCAGKTTLARQLADLHGISHVELDALHWNPNWQPTPTAEFRELAAAALAGDRWMVDGNYRVVRDIVWSRADTIVWLNYRFPLVFWRALRRTAHRVATHTQICGGNYETLATTFGRDSILLWVLTTYWRHRRDYYRELRKPEFAHLRVVVLRSPRETARWVREAAKRCGSVDLL